MKNVNEIKELAEKVKTLLMSYPHLRDSDKKLVSTVWAMDIAVELKTKVDSVTALQLLEALAEGKLSNHDSITRARRKVQQDNPDLRGTKYEERKKEAKDTKENINQK